MKFQLYSLVSTLEREQYTSLAMKLFENKIYDDKSTKIFQDLDIKILEDRKRVWGAYYEFTVSGMALVQNITKFQKTYLCVGDLVACNFESGFTTGIVKKVITNSEKREDDFFVIFDNVSFKEHTVGIWHLQRDLVRLIR